MRGGSARSRVHYATMIRVLCIVLLVGCARSPAPAVAAPERVDATEGDTRSEAIAETPPAAACAPDVTHVVSERRYRGVRSTPARRAQVAGMDGDAHRAWSSLAHGASYIECVYFVELDGARYHFTTAHDTTDATPEAGLCERERGAKI